MAKSQAEKFEQILAADPGSMIFLELARTLIEGGNLDRAVSVCRDGLVHHPNSIKGRVLLGQALLARDEADEALQVFSEALALEPDNPYAYNLVAGQLMQRKRFADALPILARAQELQPSDLRVRRWVSEARGETVAEEEVPEPVVPPSPDPAAESELLAGLPPAIPESPAPAESEAPPASDVSPPGVPPRPEARRRVADLLLEDLPESQPPRPSPERRSAPTTATVSEIERMAQRYENELRAKLDESRSKPKGFLRRHWLPLTIVTTAVLAGPGTFLGHRIIRKHYNQQHAEQFLGRAEQGLLLDTYGSLTGAHHQLDELLAADPSDARAKALRAQTQAMICHEFGCSDAQRQQALDVAIDPSVARARPEVAMAARFYLSPNPVELSDAILSLTEPSAWGHFLAGSVMLLRHDETEALKRFDAALKLAPSHIPTLLSVGEHYLRAGDAARAGELFNIAHQASPSNVTAAVGLVEAHLLAHESTADDEGALAEVAPEGERAVPSAIRQRFDLATARVLAVNGKFQKAIERLQDGVSQHGDELVAYASALADVYAYDGQYDKAENEAWRALSHNKQDADALERYGRILLARGRFRDVLSRVPASGSRRLHVLRAQAELALGSIAAARSEVEATRKDGKAPALGAVVLAQCDAKAGSAAEAKQTLRQISALPHPPVEALVALGVLDDQAGDQAAAVEDLHKAIEVDPRSFEAHCLLGRVLRKMNRSSEALPELQTAVRLNHQHVEALIAEGLLQLEQGQPIPARQLLDSAVQEAPYDAAANVALARALLALSLPTDAEHVAARAVKLAPKDAETHHWMGKIALQAGDRRVAVRELKEAKKLDKKDRAIGQDLVLAEAPGGGGRHH